MIFILFLFFTFHSLFPSQSLQQILELNSALKQKNFQLHQEIETKLYNQVQELQKEIAILKTEKNISIPPMPSMQQRQNDIDIQSLQKTNQELRNQNQSLQAQVQSLQNTLSFKNNLPQQNPSFVANESNTQIMLQAVTNERDSLRAQLAAVENQLKQTAQNIKTENDTLKATNQVLADLGQNAQNLIRNMAEMEVAQQNQERHIATRPISENQQKVAAENLRPYEELQQELLGKNLDEQASLLRSKIKEYEKEWNEGVSHKGYANPSSSQAKGLQALIKNTKDDLAYTLDQKIQDLIQNNSSDTSLIKKLKDEYQTLTHEDYPES